MSDAHPPYTITPAVLNLVAQISEAVGRLTLLTDQVQELRLRQKNEERKQGEIKKRKEREEYLSTLAKNFLRSWKTVQECVERGSGPGYNEACKHLVDLSEADSLLAEVI